MRELKTKQKQKQKSETKTKPKKSKQVRNWAKRQTDTKWRKKRYFILPLIVKIAHFIAFKVFSGLPVVASRRCHRWESLHVARGTWYEASDAWRQSKAAKTRKPNIDRDSARLRRRERGRKGVIAYLASSRWQPSRLPNVMHKSYYIPYVSHAIDSVATKEINSVICDH